MSNENTPLTPEEAIENFSIEFSKKRSNDANTQALLSEGYRAGWHDALHPEPNEGVLSSIDDIYWKHCNVRGSLYLGGSQTTKEMVIACMKEYSAKQTAIHAIKLARAESDLQTLAHTAWLMAKDWDKSKNELEQMKAQRDELAKLWEEWKTADRGDTINDIELRVNKILSSL